MTSHIHLIIGTDGKLLSDIIRDWKAFIARHIRKCLGEANFESRKAWILRVLRYKGITKSYSRFRMFEYISIRFRLKNRGDSGYFVPLHYTKFQNDGFFRAFLLFVETKI